MASSRTPWPLGCDLQGWALPARTPGWLGINDAADPNVEAFLGDTPGMLGQNDHCDPLLWFLELGKDASQAGAFNQTISAETLGRIVTKEAAQAALDQVNTAMKLGNVNTLARQAAFLAQVSHESQGLTKLKENGSDGYFNRRYGPGTRTGKNVGNTIDGDGARFKGRGMIQLTGREKYTRAWLHFGLPVRADKANKALFRGADPIHPELAAEAEWSAKIAAWYWDVLRDVNAVADDLEHSKDERRTFIDVTKKVNGGTVGLGDRISYYRKAKTALGITWGTLHDVEPRPARRKGRPTKRKGK